MKIISTDLKEHALALLENVRDGALCVVRFCRENAILVLVVLMLCVASIWYAKPMPPLHVVMSGGTPGTSYALMAQKYADYFAQNGVRLEIESSSGALENLQRVRDPNDRVMAGFVQSGIATETEAKGLLSLGSIDYEPVWFFYRDGQPVKSFVEVKDYLSQPIALGNAGSGTRVLASKLLKLTGMKQALDDNPHISTLPYQDYAQAFARGDIKSVLIVDGIESENVQALLKNPDVNITDFVRSDAYTRLLPFLQELVVPMGGLDLERNIPAHDIKLIATTTNLVVDKDLHPAIQLLFLQAARHINGEKSYFAKQDEFPSVKDGTIPQSEIARQFYANGVPVLMNYLPFWLGAFLGRLFWLLIPFATIAAFTYPFLRSLPTIRSDRLRKQIMALHVELNAYEVEIFRFYDPSRYASYVAQLEKIEKRVLSLKIIPAVAIDYSSLCSVIDSARNRLNATHRMDAQL